ncbi:unnamed protein product [Peniophora sp. CBMAI 1063]|nr:unnamed protein product [Peniophora sp. CBMAI 1063]
MVISGSEYQSTAAHQGAPTKTATHSSDEWSESVWTWLSRHNHEDAVAPCLAAEVVDMDEVTPKNRSASYYRLGRVPCMHVAIVGVLVGLIRYEKRDVYYVDDGTAVVECAHRHDGAGYDLKLPPALAREGDWVQVKGKVVKLRFGRGLSNVFITRCRSEADVLSHRRLVKALYEDRYESDDPFEIPRPIMAPTSIKPVQAAEDTVEDPQGPQPSHSAERHQPLPDPGPSFILPRTPSKNRSRFVPPSPALSEASAYTASAAGSPTKTPRSRSSPHKLRHPTRIRRQDTSTTLFRTYMMHYIAHGPSRPTSLDDSDNEYGFDEIIKTPTKRRPLTDLTPRPNKRLHSYPSPSRTPRASANPLSLPQPKEPASTECGFTMSHLRRVPELALLANKLHRQRIEEHASQSRSHSEPPRVKIKRLFTHSLIDLHKRGSIVIMGKDGIICPMPERGRGWDLEDSRLWKAGSAGSQTQGGDVSRASTRSGRSRTQEPDPDELSDPEDGEEAYVPCTARLLAIPVLSVIRSLVKTRARRGPTTARVRESLQNRDERWAYIGDLQVDEALQLLQSEGMVRKDASGTWAVL